MSNPVIKICGFQNTRIPKGIDYAGIIFHPLSKRYVHPLKAKEIVKAIKKTGSIPVAVFTEHSASEMFHICEVTDIQTVQLHGQNARAFHHELPNHYQRIYVHTHAGMTNVGLDPDRDFFLFDHVNPGCGKTWDWETLHYHGPFRWFLAGGLNVENVKTAIQKLNPYGLDIASGVENEKGEKDITLMQEFIRQVKNL